MTGLGAITVTCAAIAIVILATFWLKRPSLDIKWRVLLFVAIALLPTAAAGTSTVGGLERTTERDFCGSCHVMDAHYSDAVDPHSQSLAARHTRNKLFGEHSCYKCHANYGMNGYVLTKMDGMKHVYHYYLGEYGNMPLDEAVRTIHINKPYKNQNCMHCHAGSGKLWMAVPDHRAVAEAAEQGKISCSSVGCHGAAHPFSKEARKQWDAAHGQAAGAAAARGAGEGEE